MDRITIFWMILSAAVSFAITSAIWCYGCYPKIQRDLEDELCKAMERVDMQKAMIKSLLKENKRMLATLNHYNIKKAVPMKEDNNNER